MNTNQPILQSLKKLGLTPDEAKVYLCLLEEPMSHLEIARKTGVNRTKVYRIADELQKRGLVSEETNDEGRELAAADPRNLEIELTTKEEKLKSQRRIYKQTLPALKHLYEQGNLPDPHDFVVNTYEGVDGFKQMLWNELKAKKEILVYCFGTIQDLVDDKRWAERHREKTVEAGYIVREIINPNGKPMTFTMNADFVTKAYRKRQIDPKILPITHQFVIYNNTVAIYNWQNGQKVGAEIINKDYADMQRATFEHYWKLAK